METKNWAIQYMGMFLGHNGTNYFWTDATDPRALAFDHWEDADDCAADVLKSPQRGFICQNVYARKEDHGQEA